MIKMDFSDDHSLTLSMNGSNKCYLSDIHGYKSSPAFLLLPVI